MLRVCGLRGPNISFSRKTAVMHPHCNSFQTLFCRSLYLCDRQPTATAQTDPERVQWWRIKRELCSVPQVF